MTKKFEIVEGKACECCGELGTEHDPVRDYGIEKISYGVMYTYRFLRDSCKETLDDELNDGDFNPMHPEETAEEFMEHEDFDDGNTFNEI